MPEISVGKFEKNNVQKFSAFSNRDLPHILPKSDMYIVRKLSDTSWEFSSHQSENLTYKNDFWGSYAFFATDGKYEFSQRDLILDHLKRSKVTHLKVCLKLDLSFVSLKYIRFRQRLI